MSSSRTGDEIGDISAKASVARAGAECGKGGVLFVKGGRE
jgi:hypothetical protein